MTHVLVVDDDAGLREVYQAVLCDAGYRVTLAADGAEGLLALSEDPDVIVLDLRMPVLDGYDFMRLMPTVSTPKPVLIVAGQPDRSRLAGRPVLEKPFDADDLLIRLARLLPPSASRSN
ncbi:MAG: hypothetical protein AUH85_04725 [Chloroflexi bacterium 13_1_40CM_4_68_4]|nr:MAG: hypothetical protein AUH85_04725 [Chloroflexi bacterium 13_1_40CM_4_68_4]